MSGVAWSVDAAGSIDMTGLLSAGWAGSVHGRFRGHRSRDDDPDQRIRPGLVLPDTASHGGIQVPRDAIRRSWRSASGATLSGDGSAIRRTSWHTDGYNGHITHRKKPKSPAAAWRGGNMSREVTRAQRDWLEGEIAVWQTMGLVDEDRAQALLGLYESRESFEARQQTQGAVHIAGPGGSLVGLGVLLLIGYNWEQMPAPLKITAIFGAMIATHATAFEVRYRLGWRRLSEVVFFMGCLLYGAAIWLLAQIFHIESSNYDAVWWWAIGVLPFALLLDTILLHLLFAGLLALWLGFEVFSLDRLIWGVPSAGYSLPLLAAPGLWWAYRKSSATTVGIYVPLLAWWVVLQPIAWKLEANPTFLIGAVGSLMLVVAAMHPPRSEMGMPYRFYGIALVGATLVLLSFHGFNERSCPLRRHGLERWREADDPDLDAGGRRAFRGIYSAVEIAPGSQTGPGLAFESLRQIVARHWLALGLLGLFAFLAVLGTTRERPVGAHDRGQHRHGLARALAHSFWPDGGPEPAVRGRSCLFLVVGRSSLH